MNEWSSWLVRLRRLMCGRSVTFRHAGPIVTRGCAPDRGAAPGPTDRFLRRGIATASPQVAEPQAERCGSTPSLRLRWIFALALAAIAITPGVVSLNVWASPDESNESHLSALDPQDQNIDFSKFYHNNANHARLPCLLCHRREGTAAKTVMPGAGGHLPCTGCHAKEFANSSSPVCTVCHTNTQSGALKPFPALKSFNVRFDHSLHTRGQRASCSSCHGPARSGVAMTIPAGLNAHTTCFRCHGPQAKAADGRDISSCGTCHQLGGYGRTSTQAAAFKVGFSHAKHDRSEKLECSACHNIRAGMPQRRQVTAPLALNHHAPAGASSCATCHNGKRAFGGDDFSVCTRCHKTSWRF